MTRRTEHDPITTLLLKSPWPLSVAEIATATGFDDTTIVLAIRLLSNAGVLKQWTDGRWQLSVREQEINDRLATSEGTKFVVITPPSTRVDRFPALDTADSRLEPRRQPRRPARRH